LHCFWLPAYSFITSDLAGITAIRQLSPGEGAILKVLPWGGHPSLLLYASQRGGVHCCDLRCSADVWQVPASPSLGLAQQLVADPSGQHWLAQGTSRGWVCLWDVRFLLCVNSWQHPQR
jgi:phosphoinositide-3-kinase regulatory subunit 4